MKILRSLEIFLGINVARIPANFFFFTRIVIVLCQHKYTLTTISKGGLLEANNNSNKRNIYECLILNL